MNKTIGITMGIVVSIFLLGSLLMPLINDFNDTTLVRYNNVEQTLSKTPGSGTIEVTATFNPTSITVDGSPVNVPSNMILFASEKVLINGYNLCALHIDNGDGTKTEYNPLNEITFIVNGDTNTISLTFSTPDVTDETLVLDYGSWAYCVDPDGDHTSIVVWLDRTIYLNDLNQMYLVNSRADVFVSGVGDNVRIGTDTVKANVVTHTIENVDNLIYMNLTPNPDTTDFNYPLDDESVEARYIIVPLVVYGEKIPEHNWSSLLYAIPAVMLVALVAIMAGMVRRY